MASPATITMPLKRLQDPLPPARPSVGNSSDACVPACSLPLPRLARCQAVPSRLTGSGGAAASDGRGSRSSRGGLASFGGLGTGGRFRIHLRRRREQDFDGFARAVDADPERVLAEFEDFGRVVSAFFRDRELPALRAPLPEGRRRVGRCHHERAVRQEDTQLPRLDLLRFDDDPDAIDEGRAFPGGRRLDRGFRLRGLWRFRLLAGRECEGREQHSNEYSTFHVNSSRVPGTQTSNGMLRSRTRVSPSYSAP